MAKINKSYGPGSIITGSQIVKPLRQTITSGSLSFDAALGGGWACGHWAEIIGHECLCPGTKVLCADLVWRPIEKLYEGQEIVGFGEQLSGMGKGRTSHFEKAVVNHLGRKTLPVYEITTQYGKTLASKGHLWARDRSQREWARTDELKVGDRLASFGAPWEQDQSWEGGWLAGFFDGEGTLRANGEQQVHEISVNQVVGQTADFNRQMLEKLSFNFYELPCKRSKDHWQDQIHFRLTGYDALRLLGSLRPQRLLSKAESLWNGRSTKRIGDPTVKVLGIKYVGFREVVTIGTSSKTLVADGLLSHNSVGKTFIVLKAIAANQKIDPNFATVWYATEDFSVDYAEMLGVDVSRVLIQNEVIMERVFQSAHDFLQTKAIDCMVVDSLPFLVSEREDDGDMDEFQPGHAAILTGKFFRKSQGKIKRRLDLEEERTCTGLIINGWRDTFTKYGDPRVAPGGKGKNFVFYQRVDISRTEWITDSRKRPVGQTMQLKNIKNKIARPRLVGEVDAYVTDYKGHKAGSFDDGKDVVSAAIAYDVLGRDGTWYLFGEEEWYGQPKLNAAAQSDPQLRARLRKEVLKAAAAPLTPTSQRRPSRAKGSTKKSVAKPGTAPRKKTGSTTSRRKRVGEQDA